MDENRVFYRIFDPTGNITALVESETAADRQPSVAAALMRRHPEVEQVGFVRFCGSEDGLDGALRMAGGEFCGNASMSAAALCLLRREEVGQCLPEGEIPLRLRVSGAAEPVALRLRRETESAFRCEIEMPRPRGLRELDFAFEGARAALPVVELEGISHAVVELASPFFALRDDREAAGRAVRKLCAALVAEGCGLMFLEESGDAARLTPLVYIPGSGTEFWENSCASGSAAVGLFLAARLGKPVERALREPGGMLTVRSDPAGLTRLIGRAEAVGGRRVLTLEDGGER